MLSFERGSILCHFVYIALSTASHINRWQKMRTEIRDCFFRTPTEWRRASADAAALPNDQRLANLAVTWRLALELPISLEGLIKIRNIEVPIEPNCQTLNGVVESSSEGQKSISRNPNERLLFTFFRIPSIKHIQNGSIKIQVLYQDSVCLLN